MRSGSVLVWSKVARVQGRPRPFDGQAGSIVVLRLLLLRGSGISKVDGRKQRRWALPWALLWAGSVWRGSSVAMSYRPRRALPSLYPLDELATTQWPAIVCGQRELLRFLRTPLAAVHPVIHRCAPVLPTLSGWRRAAVEAVVEDRHDWAVSQARRPRRILLSGHCRGRQWWRYRSRPAGKGRVIMSQGKTLAGLTRCEEISNGWEWKVQQRAWT